MKIHQFHPSIVKGDAISNEVFLIQKILLKKNYSSEIFADNIGDSLENKVKKLDSINVSKNDILIIHHSMGFDSFDKIIHLPCKKILIYHNITPEHFFENEYIKKYVRIGLKQTEQYKDYIDFAYADSNYSRRELISMGYKDVGVLPVQISLDRFTNIDVNNELDKKLKQQENILFTGRIVKNKKQIDVIKTFKLYREFFNKNAKLFLVGDKSNAEYLAQVEKYIKNNGLEESVILPGKVSEQDLKTYYLNASVFLCMSEHEGFGVPLLEAMKLKVPVIAYDSSAIKETMDIGGITFEEKNYSLIAALIDEINKNKDLRNKIINVQSERIDKLEKTDTEKLLDQIIEKFNCKHVESIQLQGPFETSYSLAIVNRELIENIYNKNIYDVSIYATEGPGDYIPNEANLVDKPLAKKLYEKSKTLVYPDITIRNMYPPRVNDVNGAYNFQFFGWEESIIPEKYINDFNKYLNGIGTTSDFVTKQLIECGLTIPVKTTGDGVSLPNDFDKIKPYKLKTNKKVKFLNISSAFPRKGIDALLKAYFATFSKKDNVCLVLKTFPNPHNNVKQLLDQLQTINSPEVEWIDFDLPNNELYGLYKACDCYVSTSRGEGFGLPVAEAMLARIPTIVCNNSGLKDFANENTSLIYGYTIEKAKTHIKPQNGVISTWYEPKEKELSKLLLYFYENPDSEYIKEKINNAYNLIKNEFSWERVSQKWIDFINEVKNDSYHYKVALVSTWNSKCGIAEYSKMLFNATKYHVDYEIFPNKTILISPDEPFVRKRLWKDASDTNVAQLINSLIECLSDIVLVQFNFGFFSLENIKKIITEVAKKKKIIIEIHKTSDAVLNNKHVSFKTISNKLNLCSAIIVHQKDDKDRLVSFGVKEDLIHIIPHGQILTPFVPSKLAKERNKILSQHVVGSYGFLLPHKGQFELIQSVKLLKEKYDDILLILSCSIFNNKESKEYYKKCVDYIKENNLENNVYLNSDFLDNNQAISLLENADICALPYHNTGESASGAVRFLTSVRRPLLLSKQDIFHEFEKCSYQIKNVDPQSIAEGISYLFENDTSEMMDELNKYLEKTSWYSIARKYIDLFKLIK
ncbi:MAG TPA: hypothetical protein DDW20_01855 [Firmicutes bacterium]|nr:hypothetical protein [Bacillota bacterium]